MDSHVGEALASLGHWYVRYAPGPFGKEPLAAGLNARLRDRPRRRVVCSRAGDRFVLDTRDLIQRYIYLFGVWEPHMTAWLQRRLRPGDTFVDVGANIGYFSLLAAGLVGGEGRVVAIEASPMFHQILRRHVQLNGRDNVRAVNVAVSDKRERLELVLASNRNLGASSIVPYDGPAVSVFDVEARPLTEILDPAEIATARVIKIDVEGAEGGVVRGLAPLLDKLRPDAEITVEVTPDRMAKLGDSVEELLNTMQQSGFHMYRLANDYAPESYPAAQYGRPAVPVRWRGPVVAESDLVFSRVDAEVLP
ncbi:FkbM family methyltransferase [Streptomyces sp. NPDC002537]